jgi:hypothetical protein
MMIEQGLPASLNVVSANFESPNTRDKNAPAISALTLAHLNLSVFRQLRKLGTPKQRVCTTLNLTPSEYDFVCTLA